MDVGRIKLKTCFLANFSSTLFYRTAAVRVPDPKTRCLWIGFPDVCFNTCAILQNYEVEELSAPSEAASLEEEEEAAASFFFLVVDSSSPSFFFT